MKDANGDAEEGAGEGEGEGEGDDEVVEVVDGVGNGAGEADGCEQEAREGGDDGTPEVATPRAAAKKRAASSVGGESAGWHLRDNALMGRICAQEAVGEGACSRAYILPSRVEWTVVTSLLAGHESYAISALPGVIFLLDARRRYLCPSACLYEPCMPPASFPVRLKLARA
jgi:hypothetical protein